MIELQKRVTKLNGVKYGTKDKEHKKKLAEKKEKRKEKNGITIVIKL